MTDSKSVLDPPMVKPEAMPAPAQLAHQSIGISSYSDANDGQEPYPITLRMEEAAELTESENVKHSGQPVPIYIQGLIQESRACLVTNLLKGQSRTLYQPQMVWTLGRNREAAIPLKDQTLSRHHAVIMYIRDAGFFLIDLKSMNGTCVNDKRIQQRHRLQDGDRIRLDRLEITFFVSELTRSIAPIHPEVLTRLNATDSEPDHFVEFCALDETSVGLFSESAE